MGDSNDKKLITLDDLAAMVTRVFEDVVSRIATKDDIAQVCKKWLK